MSNFRKLAHAVWECKYHFVWCPKIPIPDTEWRNREVSQRNNTRIMRIVNGFFKMYQNRESKMYHLSQFLRVGVQPPFPICP
jgi:hypothetical protein